MIEKIHLKKDGCVNADDLKIGEILNKSFANVVSDLNLNTWNPNYL